MKFSLLALSFTLVAVAQTHASRNNNNNMNPFSDNGNQCFIKSIAPSKFFNMTLNDCKNDQTQDPADPTTFLNCSDLTNMQPQAPANVTMGYKGTMDYTKPSINDTYWSRGMCPINVHWHTRAEHLSMGQYDEEGTGPTYEGSNTTGYRCNLYKGKDKGFTKKYDWKHCQNMVVGETYEVHWPHSRWGDCGTFNQYQTPFPFGVTCRGEPDVDHPLEDNVGVQGQVFTIINDEYYYHSELIRGMIVEKDLGMGMDLTFYTGSATSDKVNNTVCSEVTPISWQVDRKCHLISASSFDKLCYDMKMQRDNMTADMKPDGSRVLVLDAYAASNQVFVGV